MNGFALLGEAYEKTKPGYDGHTSVPVLWDRQTDRIVSNTFPDITLDLATAFTQWSDPTVGTYPVAPASGDRRTQRAALHLGQQRVYRCGFAPDQQSYDAAVVELFGILDELERRLADPSLPARREDHRVGRSALGDADQVRRGLRDPTSEPTWAA